ncbi:DctP family TRAP transporter solute-binding subunit [bacterium LRH843]|nr:DctP family TRAP transporter solute-binding subunit [bacterium LRH843]
MKNRWAVLFMSLFTLTVLSACSGDAKQTTSPVDSGKAITESSGENTGSGEFEKMTLALGHGLVADETSHYHQGAVKFKELVEEATGGNVTIEIHPNGSLGGDREMAEGIQLGTLDMAIIASAPLGNFASKSNAFDFPFLFRDRDHVYAVLDGEPGEEVNEQLAEVGIKVLAWAENGFRNMSSSAHPIVNPEDLKGLKIRTMENQVHLAAFQAYGAAPTPMNFQELFSAMQQGVVDGQENPLGVIVPNKFYEVQKYLTISEHVYSPAPLIMNTEKFNGFSPELQEVFMKAAAEMRDWERNFVAEKNEQFLQTAIDKGMEVVTADEFNYDAFFEATKPVYEKYADEYGEFLEKIIAVE